MSVERTEKLRQYQREYQKRYRQINPAYKEMQNRSHRNWMHAHKEQAKLLKLKSQAKRYQELRVEAIAHYSNGTSKCARCGFSDLDALELDHINGDGAKDRAINPSGYAYFRFLKKNNYPIELQVLCHNCHVIKSRREKRIRLGLPI